ncbi:UPF0676 protein C1494.01-like isoform X2 [Strongylocentrotus purpuratus]|uniref:Fe2OG dioxygenase domain-containing protein n=1 Tax=Strongylocentrotus purpuratus TaxID=7668 RepID=A0A7M7P2H6_STRPU|nr:UPF0676 protein C1494.01-like isoform X1 [Strongylocentrotus purpuratus]XP_030844483.1 UPF0676 protein C1494.01-like isoform X2 [Strongylocentrotus purpuratus]
MAKSIAIIDFDCFRLDVEATDEKKFEKLVDEVHDALTKVGFMYLVNHGIPLDKIRDTFAASKKFFEQSEDTKMNYIGQSDDKFSIHGFEETEKEQCCPERERDLKQCFNYTVKAATDDVCATPYMWPDKTIPEFRQSMEELYRWCTKLNHKILDVIGHGLKLPDPHYFKNLHKGLGTKENCTILRSLYYPPPVFEKVKDNQIRCGEHTDYGGITLLFQDKQGGLEVQDVEGDWIQAKPVEDAVIVNLGDLMQMWTADQLIASVHRVVMPKTSEPRQSIVFFGHPDDDEVIECVDGSNKYPPINSLEYLEKRLYDTY